MNIKDLTIKEISGKIESYVKDYFKDSRVTNYTGELFTENYTLQFDEIDVDLPQKHLFQDTDQINNASGYVYLANISEEHKGYEYIIILLYNGRLFTGIIPDTAKNQRGNRQCRTNHLKKFYRR